VNRLDERWVTARHEAGHAVAALHYCCLAHASIEPDGIALGTTRIRVQERQDAIVVYCGPLAELDWSQLRPGDNIEVPVVGTDFENLQYLRGIFGNDLQDCYEEAIRFVSHPIVQQRIDRVAHALLERTRLTADEVREVVASC
jgi:ATP-dependent Zn protease